MIEEIKVYLVSHNFFFSNFFSNRETWNFSGFNCFWWGNEKYIFGVIICGRFLWIFHWNSFGSRHSLESNLEDFIKLGSKRCVGLRATPDTRRMNLIQREEVWINSSRAKGYYVKHELYYFSFHTRLKKNSNYFFNYIHNYLVIVFF